MRKVIETIGFTTVLIGGAAVDGPSMVPAVVCMGIGAVLIRAAAYESGDIRKRK